MCAFPPAPLPFPPRADLDRPPVVVRFKSVGSAPIMKQNFYKITASNRFQAVMVFLRKELGWKGQDPLVRRARNVRGRVEGALT